MMELAKMLRRIKFFKEVDHLDIDLLNELCISFAASIPYETLDIFGGKKNRLNLERVFEKVVVHNRGGMCIELNSLFHWMLSQLGYGVKMCMGYTLKANDDLFQKEASHMVLLVSVGDGMLWLTDVGWGGNSFIFPLNMHKLAEEQKQPNGVYMITKWDELYVVQKKAQAQILISKKASTESCDSGHSKYAAGEDWNVLFSFKTQEKQLSDFQDACAYAQEAHPFCTQNSCAVLQDRNHRIFLIGNALIEKKYVDPSTLKVVSIRKLNHGEISEVLKTKFGIELDFSFEPKSNLEWHVV